MCIRDSSDSVWLDFTLDSIRQEAFNKDSSLEHALSYAANIRQRAVSYTHLDVYKRQAKRILTHNKLQTNIKMIQLSDIIEYILSLIHI